MRNVFAIGFLILVLYLPTLWSLFAKWGWHAAPNVSGVRVQLRDGWAPFQAKKDSNAYWFILPKATTVDSVVFIRDRFPVPLMVDRLSIFESHAPATANTARSENLFENISTPVGPMKALKREHQRLVLKETFPGEVVISDEYGLTFHVASLDMLQDIVAIERRQP